MSQIYLDANATSAVRPEAQAMVRSLLDGDADARNPSSIHRSGRVARKLVSEARENVKKLLTLGEDSSSTLFFTSGGTESCNTLIHGFLSKTPAHIISSSIEHPAIIEPLKRLAALGCRVDWIDPGPDGIVNPTKFAEAVRPETELCVLMTANNETGAIQPVAEMAKLLRSRRYFGAIISDYTQALSKTLISAQSLFDAGVDAVCVSAHKIGAIKGVGAILLNSSDKLCREFSPFFLGGPQEQGYRAGTENVLAIATFGEVSRVLLPCISQEVARLKSLRDELRVRILTSVSGLSSITPLDLDGSVRSLSNTLLLEIPGCRGDDLVVALDILGIAASTGSACQSGKQGVSHAMTAMGRVGHSARDVIRLSIDWDANEQTIVRASEIISQAILQMRSSRAEVRAL